MHVLMKNIEKSFGDNKVLHDAKIEILPGEVHALMGENGAGKSTLMNILTGVHTRDAGEILFDGQPKDFSGPKEAEEFGIAFIHQELNVLVDMTVEENMYLNKEIKNKFGMLDKKAMRNKCQELLTSLETGIKPTQEMSELSIGQQQMVEISKALMSNVEVIIMDEPTAALTDSETKKLFEVIEQLTANNVAIVYISHRMEEIFQISDRITVMRDGHYIGTKQTNETNENELVKMMIGRELTNRYPTRETKIGEVVFEVKDLTLEDESVNNVSFDVKAGEILGFSGLMGSGRSEVMHGIFGSKALKSGEIFINGRQEKIDNPLKAIDLGLGFVTEDRKSEGLLLEKSIRENLTVTNFKELAPKGFINESAEKEMANSAVQMFKIKTFNTETETGNLSGGNQQKVVMAKWVLTNPKILILDEPTRGVDVGAKEEIYQIMNDLTKQGIAIIMVSSDLPEVIGMSDRVAIMREGELKAIIDKEQISEENIMTIATGGTI
ncbi:D-ribose transporter ATP-binding protein [Globicatella sp. HMSC072A10]|uniref:sugar ABC transporter ATP-binding protein n=1 Tax=Globicatella sp. HMSC072A10 TaxID=1739315 RepID=UPI0008CFF0D3|nr:sugar ABC transporter ATP-binding protein [Globicatella sp. HMSC072A10]OFK58860.1 D-ribose transporter ATP-binding protein [Globicatella sp. HMSC072A10]